MPRRKDTALRFYKHDPKAFLDGVRVLSDEECGVYIKVLNHIYLRNGDLPNDDRFVSGLLGSDIRVWKRIKERLLELGKLKFVEGNLVNRRANEVLDEFRKTAPKTRGTSAGAPPELNDKSVAKPLKSMKMAYLTSTSQEPDGYTSFDGTVKFTAQDIADLKRKCPLLVDPLGQITHLAESSWMDRVVPADRKRAILAKLTKDHGKLVEKAPKVPKQTAAEKAADEDEAEARRREEDAALAVRMRLHAKHLRSHDNGS